MSDPDRVLIERILRAVKARCPGWTSIDVELVNDGDAVHVEVDGRLVLHGARVLFEPTFRPGSGLVATYAERGQR